MEHPFKVGEKYRNRDGAYEVVELDEPGMVIRYDDGRQVETSVDMQARIWGNIQSERERRREALHPSPSRKGPRESPHSGPSRTGRRESPHSGPSRTGRRESPHSGPSRTGRRITKTKNDFAGLGEGDFQRGIAGTTWRARLGRLLTTGLSDAAHEAFQLHVIFRRAEVHVALPEHYHDSQEGCCRDAKFVFTLDPERALYGLYVEKNKGPMDATWHWPNLLAALAEDETLQSSLLEVMPRLGLQWEVYANPEDHLLARVTAGAEGLEWQPDGGEAIAIGWPDFVQRLAQIDENEWCNLYLCARMPKAQAIAAGARMANPAVEVYRALLPLYEAAVRSR